MRPLIVSLIALVAGCRSGPQPTVETGPPAELPARLVVLVILDQLGSETLVRLLPHLPADGAIRSGVERGAYFSKVVYPYSGTFTAAGHATIHTGVAPAVHGVAQNEVLGPDRSEVSCAEDGEHATFGVEGHTASPVRLRVPTVADALEEQTVGRAITVSLSYKDRGAVYAGRRINLAVWYEKSIPGFTTSAYYEESVPAWLTAWQAANPIDSLLVPWTPGDPELLARVAGADDAPGEGDHAGLGRVFPHDPATTGEPYTTLRATPQASELLLDLATEAALVLHMGEDEVPDLLAVSVSGIDYAGHVFGPDSWEYLDHLIRVDRALGELLRTLERERGPVAMLITSDHGHAPLPEHAGSGGRIAAPALVAELDAAVDRRLGDGDWVAGFVQPFVYLSPTARAGAQRDAVIAAVLGRLGNEPSVEVAHDIRTIAAGQLGDSELDRLITASVATGVEGDIFVVPARGYFVEEDYVPGHGTSHGTPWPYDREVPVIVQGHGARPARVDDPQDTRQVAPTVARLLGITPPDGVPPSLPLR